MQLGEVTCSKAVVLRGFYMLEGQHSIAQAIEEFILQCVVNFMI